MKEIVLVPVGVDQVVVAKGLSAGLTTVDIGTDGGQPFGGHYAAIVSTEGGVNEVREVVDVVHRGEERRIDLMRFHMRSHGLQAAIHFPLAECRRRGRTVIYRQGSGTLIACRHGIGPVKE